MVREHVINCRGRPENPMSPEEVEKKAAWLMEPVLGKKMSIRSSIRFGVSNR